MPRSLTRHELTAELSQTPTPVLVEALAARHYRDGHLPGARHLPHDRVAELAPTILPDKRAPIVVYCASSTCRNSHLAAQALERMGYANVGVYGGGKQDWVEAGLALERGDAAD